MIDKRGTLIICLLVLLYNLTSYFMGNSLFDVKGYEHNVFSNVYSANIENNYEKAYKLLLPLAEQGNAQAQNNLGRMFLDGQGVSQDFVVAHMWFNLSSSNGIKDAMENRKIVEEKLTPQQIGKAQEMATNWKPKINFFN